MRRGDFSVRLSEEGDDEDSEIAVLFNEVVGLNQQITGEFERLSKVVGKEGKIDHRAKVRNATGGWDSKLRAVNELIDDMVQPTTEVARVIGSVAKGDLSQTMAVEIDGRPLQRRVPAHRQGRQHDGRSVGLLRLRSDARRARGRHRGQIGRPGATSRASPARGRI